MEIKDLSYQALDDLTNSLEKPTLNWEELMQSKTFGTIYSAKDINKIRMTGGHPAKALIEDLICRKTTVQDLLSGLKQIGNGKAIWIIEGGR